VAVGLGYRHPFSAWIDTAPTGIECLELTASHFSNRDFARIEQLAQRYPLMVHALGCSVGTPGPMNADEMHLLTDVIDVAKPLWLSDHLGFVRTPEADLGHFCPLIPNPENVAIVGEHARELSERFGVPVLLENATSHIQVKGPLADTEFINRTCERGGCGLLLDVTNLYVNSRNHGFDPVAWLREIDPEIIKQLHVVGYSQADNLYFDSHNSKIDKPLWELTREVAAYASVETVILERDSNFPPPQELLGELMQLKQMFSQTQK
jgi:uncharacterized protein (UPF0276 family)